MLDLARRDTTIEIDAVVGDKLIQSNIRDISGSGVFINTNPHALAGTTKHETLASLKRWS